MSNLKGKVAVVTGASSGIGKAIARALAEQGMQLCLIGRNVQAMREFNGAKVRSMDLGDESQIRDCASAIARELPQVDVLVHSAGVTSMGTLEDSNIADLDHQYRINVRAPYLLTQLLLPLMKTGKGQIVFINSTAGRTSRAGVSQYAATKHALMAIADALREEIAPLGMRVISILPGRTDTPMQQLVHRLEGRAYKPEALLKPADVAGMVVHALSMPRSAEVKDLTILPSRGTCGESYS